jgi:hypothetical protein
VGNHKLFKGGNKLSAKGGREIKKLPQIEDRDAEGWDVWRGIPFPSGERFVEKIFDC